MLTDLDMALRFLRAGHADETLQGSVRETVETLERKVTPRWVWRAFDLNRTADGGIGLTGAALTLTSVRQM